MRHRRHFFLSFLLLIGISLAPSLAPAQRKDGWLPITPEDLAMKSFPGAAGAHAVVLYRESITDDVESFETNYYRVKILTEEGKKQGDVEIPYLKGKVNIHGLKARTIRPDGSVVEFDGKVFDKTVVKLRGIKVFARAFTLPEVQVGSIIEYRYRAMLDTSILFSAYWPLQAELFTKQAKFSFRPDLRGGRSISWTGMRLPAGNLPKEKGSWFTMEIENVPAFEEEQYMPPEREMRMRVEFSYVRVFEKTADEFWKQQGKELHGAVEDFIGKRGGIATAANQLTASATTPEEKLRKLYERVQQIRNLSYERERSEKEAKQEKLKDNNNIEDVLKNGYGDRGQLARLFVGLARAAGFTASIIHVAERDDHFFHKEFQSEDQLDAQVALVRVGNDDRFFDPGMPSCPFGMLAWQKTDVPALKADKNGGSFISTPKPLSKDGLTEHKATLRLTEEGTLQGKVEIIFSGLEAVRRRRYAMDKDEEQRRKDMEDLLKERLPSNATVKVENVTGLEGSGPTMKVEYSMEAPGFASYTGRRMLLPASVFHYNSLHPFQHAQRQHPIYFDFPFQDKDDITIELPAGYTIESLPPNRKVGSNVMQFEAGRENQSNKLRLRRELSLDIFFIPASYYPSMRQFYDQVRAGDEEQAVLRAGQSGNEK